MVEKIDPNAVGWYGSHLHIDGTTPEHTAAPPLADKPAADSTLDLLTGKTLAQLKVEELESFEKFTDEMATHYENLHALPGYNDVHDLYAMDVEKVAGPPQDRMADFLDNMGTRRSKTSNAAALKG